MQAHAKTPTSPTRADLSQTPVRSDLPLGPTPPARADLRSDRNKIGDVPSPTSTVGQFSMLRVRERKAVLALTMPSVSNFDRRSIFNN